jgi:hypothetical protein
MDDFSPQPAVVRNPITRQRHQREIFWQVTVPMLIGSVILLVPAGLAVAASFGLVPDNTRRWADISMIWMIIPVMFMTLLTLVFLAGSVYALMRLILVLPKYSYQALGWLLLLGLNLQRLNDRLVEPFLRMHMLAASMKTLGRRVSKKG